MRLVTFRASIESEAHLGVIEDDLVIDVALIGAHADVVLQHRMLDLIDRRPIALAALARMYDHPGKRLPIGAALPLANVTLLARVRFGNQRARRASAFPAPRNPAFTTKISSAITAAR
jgi:hypothetical protein